MKCHHPGGVVTALGELLVLAPAVITNAILTIAIAGIMNALTTAMIAAGTTRQT